ncbi:MAG: c-type cytochrome [Deltaproteobacteria bacterium]|nr:c-type cytochrome [Deltaproteobacteria bacterium]MBK8239777.1 c-type cytochrome [Deltaproteobacteria bacterium]MBK8714510.1 c-type cytochrome [Deltaproteobacteria bacterium]MBP7288267.1 c-type cytochrome [Nannocystaceae bacterium]
MLSKSQARGFFLLGTAACAIAFVGLTIDTFGQLPERTHAEEITPAVARGKALWESSNCMGCHTLFGEGAYYAPELTKVYERRGEYFIRAMLVDPASMYPGERRMQRYDFSLEDQDALLAFLRWAGTVDLNGFPAEPNLMPIATAGGIAAGNRPQLFNSMCVACHAMGGQGGQIGPALDGVGARRDAAYLRKWLENPLAVKADSRMPKLPLTDPQIDEMVAFLSQQKD